MRLTISPEPALLGFLLDGPLHGYDLYKQANTRLGLVWTVGLSQLYAIVKTFERRGWVQVHLRSQRDRPSQKALELTPAGRSAFQEWLGQPARGLREFRVDFFLRLYFARTVGPSFARELIDGQIQACRDELQNLRERRAEAGATEQELYQLTRDFRIQQLTTICNWLERHRAQLTLSKPKPRRAGRTQSSRARPHPRSPVTSIHQNKTNVSL